MEELLKAHLCLRGEPEDWSEFWNTFRDHDKKLALLPEIDPGGRVRQGGVTPQRHPDHQLAATSSPLTSSAASPSITSRRAFASDSALM